MSFAGHVFDMIRRNKEDREKLKQIRKHTINDRINYTSRIPDISAEEFEEIRKNTKEREAQQEKYISQTTLLILGITILTIFLLLVILKIFF